MITAVDTNVLLDVLLPDPEFGLRSKAALKRSVGEGGLIAAAPVWVETGSWFKNQREMNSAMQSLGVEFEDLDLDACLLAANAWRSYRRQGGTRDRVAADFLIGAHAQRRADRLLTRDRGFFRTYFRGLKILDPIG